ncbi:hypothetical protein J7K97_03200, partial [Candidatus Aerophobetes bacterium]|nr:hypothetical protein [Candidatus Aerophobetes bacterium]
GGWTGRLYYYENVGSATKSVWIQCDSMFNNIYVGSYEAPGLADLDGDGDVDLTLGEGDAVLNYYQNLLLSSDNTPPVISNVTVEPSLVKPNVATTFTVTASISDAKSGVSLSTTLAHIQNPDENDLASFLLYDDGTHGDEISGDGIFTGQWTGSVPGISYVDITASDNLGNQSEAENAASILSDTVYPEVQITSPLSGALISGVVLIEGTAEDDNFKNYILSFGEGTDPLTWTTITISTNPVSAGILATWDTGNISGTFSLKLTAEDRVQNKSEDKIVVIVDNSYPRTWLITSPPSVVTRREPIIFSWQGIDNITESSNLKYQYKLEGYDTDWSDWSSDTQVTYPELPQGRYTFYARAKDETGSYPPKDNPATASFSFTTRYALIVYPNPWYNTKHQGLPIVFSGVLPGSKIKIYTLSVEKVKELDVREGMYEVNWDLCNEQGEFVGRGIYLYIALFPDGTKKTGKIAVIK